AALADLAPEPTPWSPAGLRIALGADAKNPATHAAPPFIKGLVEIQDEGSQLAALLAGARPGEQVVDLCAGAGGKTLALAAAMENRGQIYATDLDKRRLAPIHARLARAGVRNVQVRTLGGARGTKAGADNGDGVLADLLADLNGRTDLVMIDAPCTGTGAWRRGAPRRMGFSSACCNVSGLLDAKPAYAMTSRIGSRQPRALALEPAMASHDKILIIDFGSQVTQLIARRVREEKVYCEIAPFQKAEAALAALKPKVIILSGGPASVHEKDAPLAPAAVYQAGVPVL